MSATLDFSLITTVTPEPYEEQHPNRQRENFYYALNQMIAQLKADSAVLVIDLADITQAVQDLSFAGGTVEIGGFRIEKCGKVYTLHNV